jgi:lipoprotein-anchoring transpeptidase ErfK/SrfK
MISQLFRPAVRRSPAGARAALSAALTVVLGAAVGTMPRHAAAQRPSEPAVLATTVSAGTLAADSGVAQGTARPTVPMISRFRSERDSVAYERTRGAAERTTRLRIVVQLENRELAVLDGEDTLMVAPVAVGMDTTIHYGDKSWTFETPRGQRSILRKQKDPVWVPPEWHYAEVAGKRGLTLAHLKPNRPVRLLDGRSLVVRGGRAGLVDHEGTFSALPADEEIVFDGTLYVPPLGSQNRRIPGELGRFKLDLGNGYLLHGTPYEDTIGDAATHGCVRLFDEDIEWLFEKVPVGTPVFIY